MTRDRWIFGLALAATIAVVVAVILAPKVGEALAPELVRAHVATSLRGARLAEVRRGPLLVPAGTEVSLHAVLEAVLRDGTPVYYTSSPELMIDGVAVPPERLLRWERPQEAKIRWFTIEPTRTELEIDEVADLGQLRFETMFRPDWPQAWSAPLFIDPRFDDGLDPERRRPQFGTVRIQVRIELFGVEQKLVPQIRYSSHDADTVLADPDAVATVVVTLADGLELASSGFGLTHLALRTADTAVVERADELTDRRLAVALPVLLGNELRRRGIDPAQAPWRLIDFVESELRWGADGVAPGDLLRVGGRVVFLLGDSNGNGRLDPEDESLDFDRGAAVRPLAEVFGAGGAVELLGSVRGSGAAG